ncbi:MAG: hypothetical protein WD250_15200 [Egibacteraceae bacterium]
MTSKRHSTPPQCEQAACRTCSSLITLDCQPHGTCINCVHPPVCEAPPSLHNDASGNSASADIAGTPIEPIGPFARLSGATALALGFSARYGADHLGVARIDQLSSEQHRQLDLVAQWPLAAIRWRLEKDNTVPWDLIDSAIFEMRRYLALIALSDEPVGMISPYVDEAWHAFVLHTREWEVFCHVVYGKLVHHAPNLPDDVAAPVPPELQRYVGISSGETASACHVRPCDAEYPVFPDPDADPRGIPNGRSPKPGGPISSTPASVVTLYRTIFAEPMAPVWFAHLPKKSIEENCQAGPLDCFGGCWNDHAGRIADDASV